MWTTIWYSRIYFIKKSEAVPSERPTWFKTAAPSHTRISWQKIIHQLAVCSRTFTSQRQTGLAGKVSRVYAAVHRVADELVTLMLHNMPVDHTPQYQSQIPPRELPQRHRHYCIRCLRCLKNALSAWPQRWPFLSNSACSVYSAKNGALWRQSLRLIPSNACVLHSSARHNVIFSSMFVRFQIGRKTTITY